VHPKSEITHLVKREGRLYCSATLPNEADLSDVPGDRICATCESMECHWRRVYSGKAYPPSVVSWDYWTDGEYIWKFSDGTFAMKSDPPPGVECGEGDTLLDYFKAVK
jgi:hypothetical protein